VNPLARPICALWLLAVGVAPLVAQKWQIQYFYDKPKSTFVIADLQFPTPERGIAVGMIQEGTHQDPTSVITSDGGAHWQVVDIKEPPLSLFFLNETLGWMVTTKGLWQTAEAGRSWTRLPKPPGPILRVYFLDENHGYAVGTKKTAVETKDGGKTWQKMAVVKPEAGENVNYSAYNWIAFATPTIGLITGWNVPPRRSGARLPAWVDPDQTLRQRESPHLSYSLGTGDGGKTWTSGSGSLFGTVSRVRFGPKGLGLGLIQYGEAFRFPSETYAINWPAGTSRTVFRDPKFNVTDIWLTSDGTAYMAGTQVRGQLHSLIPGKVRVMTSKNLKDWTTMAVDYRAEGINTILAGAGDDHLWMATDRGMILKLAR
jgi:hypothetical protein